MLLLELPPSALEALTAAGENMSAKTAVSLSQSAFRALAEKERQEGNDDSNLMAVK
jgi:hypothetical protein